MKAAVKKSACLGLTVLMAASFAAGNVVAFLGDETSAASLSERPDTVEIENLTGKLDLTGLSVQNLSPAVLENIKGADGKHAVIVSLAGKSLLARAGGASVSEYLSTGAGRRAERALEAERRAFLETLSSQGVGYELLYEYDTVLNGVALNIDLNDFSALRGISAVQSAVVSETYALPAAVAEGGASDATVNPNNVYATGIYDSSEYVKEGIDGRGMTVAILDTGLDYTHEAFRKQPAEPSFTKAVIAEKLAEKQFTAEGSTPGLTADDVFVSNKVPYAYDYADKDDDVYPAYANHGTHVAGIVAGQADSYVPKDSEDVARDENGQPIPFRGVAPEAQLVICKVFTDDLYSDDIGGATSEDIVAALEDCVNLGVDVINMSLGTAAGFSTIEIDGDTEGAMLNTVYTSIRDAGISLICAASNEYSAGYGSAFGTNLASNPDSGTVGSPSTFVGALSVASINGQSAPYMMANGNTPVFYTESSDANSVPFDFAEQMLGDGETAKTFKYVVIPGIGQPVDYTAAIRNRLADKEEGEKVIAVIRRGTTNFEDKVEIAQENGADAVIIYNNVAGTVRMSLGDLEDPVPAVSVNMDAGIALTTDENGRARTTGTIELNTAYQAGPFMNDYSSWGPTPDLKLKPEVTAHGGEITSTVPGGYDEQSGTSMASPNLAGFMALLKQYLKGQDVASGLSALDFTNLANNILMSTAVTVYDEEGLPYSPRKQGSGLATLANVFGTKSYLYTLETEGGPEEGRPKWELGEDKEKEGVYHMAFHVQNFGSLPLEFKAKSTFMTETLASDGLAVAESAHLFGDNAAVWLLDGAALAESESFTVNANSSRKLEVTLELSAAEKRYLDDTFENGMFVEGFLTLVSATDGQCDLNFPFMGFYGDWSAAPMLDFDVFELAEYEKDPSLNENERPKANVWATQLYAEYYNNRYVVPMGSFAYIQDDDDTVEKIYDTEDHSAVSQFNIYNGYNANDNYLTTTGFKALYAGLLRGAELVTYDLYDEYTGELLLSKEAYRVSKSYSNGGAGRPSQVLMELSSTELGLVNNGKYRFDFHFWFKQEDAEDPANANEDNTYSVTFYADYEAPTMTGARIRYYDYKDGTRDMQDVYLDVDVYDNHYPQSVLLYYSDYEYSGGEVDTTTLKMATKYATPVYRAVRNGTTTVSINITDIYKQKTFENRLYVQLDDYALNHSVYALSFASANSASLPTSFTVTNGTEITLGVNETHKVALGYTGSASLANFNWSSSRFSIANVQNGEIVGVSPGSAVITVTAGANARQDIRVTVVDKGIKLPYPRLSFGTLFDSTDSIKKAAGSVDVNAGDTFTLKLLPEPWYYPVDKLNIRWTSSNERYATVDENGVVTTKNDTDKRGLSVITATILDDNNAPTTYSATVILNVQIPFVVENLTLTHYVGPNSGIVVIPDDMNIMTIGEEAFKDFTGIEGVVIPKTVTTIDEYAFENCSGLKNIWFVSEEKQNIADAGLTLIEPYAFTGCTSLKKLDLTNCKVFTVGHYAFADTGLEEIVAMEKIGTAHDYAFSGTKLSSADISGMHNCGRGVFMNCTLLTSVTTGEFTPVGEEMFRGCTKLDGTVTLNNGSVGARAFYGCGSLDGVAFGTLGEHDFITLGSGAFNGCYTLTSVDFGGNAVSALGDGAFAGCEKLTSFELPAGVRLGDRVFADSGLTSLKYATAGNYEEAGGAIYSGNTLLLAGPALSGSFTPRAGTTAIAPYAFAGSNVTEVVLTGISEIGEGAFRDSKLAGVSFPEGLTQIAPLAFAGSALTGVVISDQITSIGDNAFADCADLASVTFDAGSALASVGNAAFANCTALGEIEFPDVAASLGNSVFEGCTHLTSVTLPSVTAMGSYNFAGANRLTTLRYGANAAVTGSYNFLSQWQYFTYRFGGPLTAAPLNSVQLGAQTSIGAGAFMATSLASVDLKNAVSVGTDAFAYCRSLAAVTGLDLVTSVGDAAFYGCERLNTLSLGAAKTIGAQAFAGTRATTVALPVAEDIGDMAFYEIRASRIELPATVKSVGFAAFGNDTALTAVEAAENDVFFSEDGVLYRNIRNARGGKDTYELVQYPAGKAGTQQNGIYVFSVKEGTSVIGEGAFIGAGTAAQLDRVVLPYSVKGVGDSAFFGTNINEYEFRSIAAPAIYAKVWETQAQYCYSLYSRNFTDAFIAHTQYNSRNNQGGTVDYGVARNLTMYYPSNGSGYVNYTFNTYFSARRELGELMEDDTRTLKEMLEAEDFSVATVEGLAAAPVSEESKAQVVAFSERVKEAHRRYNNVVLRGETQVGFLGSENVEKLSAVEAALKPVKTKFGVTASVVSLSIDPACTYKSTYKAGEKFDITGLQLVVNYDDYTSEPADMSRITLDAAYSGELSVYNRYVYLNGYGMSVMIAVTVTEDGTEMGGGDAEDGGVPVVAIVVPVCAAVLVAGAAVTAVLLLKKKRGAKASAASGKAEAPEAPEEPHGDDTPDGEGN